MKHRKSRAQTVHVVVDIRGGLLSDIEVFKHAKAAKEYSKLSQSKYPLNPEEDFFSIQTATVHREKKNPVRVHRLGVLD